jgi:hypothetical protein
MFNFAVPLDTPYHKMSFQMTPLSLFQINTILGLLTLSVCMSVTIQENNKVDIIQSLRTAKQRNCNVREEGGRCAPFFVLMSQNPLA